jgi:hypothetical protein
MELLRPFDVVVALRCVAHTVGDRGRIADDLARRFSPDVLEGSFHRLAYARLYSPLTGRFARGALHDFLVHGLPYAFPAHLGSTRAAGVLTTWSAPLGLPLLLSGADAVVWPHATASGAGVPLEPLDPSVPEMALEDPEFYRLAALVEVRRVGRARERSLAAEALRTLSAA